MAVSSWVCRRCTLRLLAIRSSNRRACLADTEHNVLRQHARDYNTEVESRPDINWDNWFCTTAPYTSSLSNATVHDRAQRSYRARSHRQWRPSVQLQSSFAPQVEVPQATPQIGDAALWHTPVPAPVSIKENELRDERWVRENLEYPTREDHPWAPMELFDETGSLRALLGAFDLVRPKELTFRLKDRFLREGRRAYWRADVEADSRDGSIHVFGEGYTQHSAQKSAVLQLVAALHVKNLIQRPSTIQNLTLADRLPADQMQDPNAKLHVYNFAAQLGAIPEFHISGGPEVGGVWHVTVTVKTSTGLDLQGSASATFLEDAEYKACVDFKVHASKSIGSESIDVQDLQHPNLDNARTILSIFSSNHPDVKLERRLETSQRLDGVLVWWAGHSFGGEELGPLVAMTAKDKALKVADLVAAVTLTQRHPQLMQEYVDARTQANGLCISRDTPITAAGIDAVASSFLAVSESYIRSTMARNPATYSSTRTDSQTIGGQVLLGHFMKRLENHYNRMSSAARSENLRVLQDYYRFNNSLDEIKEQRSALPITESRDEIINTIAANPYTIVIGSTASGKSTQIPQMILEDAIANGDGASCNIVCTQPRRIAAVALAQRVALERDEAIGEVVGYQISGSYPVAELGGSITYSTPELQSLQLEFDVDLVMDGVSHFIIDEAHLRDRHNDRLITLLKQSVKKRVAAGKSAPKIILMSATLHTETFEDYFRDVLPTEQSTIPTISVPGRLYPVKETFLDELLQDLRGTLSDDEYNELLGHEDTKSYVAQETALAVTRNPQDEDIESRTTSPPIQWESRAETTRSYRGMPYLLIAAVVAHALRTSSTGDVLVFLPGLLDLEMTKKTLTAHAGIIFKGITDYSIELLHSIMTGAVDEALSSSTPERRQVLLSTNIAETSVTFPNVSQVIDTGRRKTILRHELLGVENMEDCWISQASATQRAGRAGRLRPGSYYALYSNERLQTFEPTQSSYSATPIDLMRPSLRALRAQLTPEEYFETALDKPETSNINAALAELRSLGALTDQHQLTALGDLLARIPLAPPLAMLALHGLLFRCLEPLLVIAIATSDNHLFFRPEDKHGMRRAQTMRLYFSQGTFSDHISFLNAYREMRQVHLDEGAEKAEQWAKNSFIDYRRFLAIDRQVQGLVPLLRSLNILQEPYEAYNTRADNTELIQALATAAMYPKVAVHSYQATFQTPLGIPALVSKFSNYHFRYTASFEPLAKKNPLAGDILCFSAYSWAKGDYAMMRDMSKTSPLTLTLFGARKVEIKDDAPHTLILDGWLSIKVKDAAVAQEVLRLRTAWKSAFHDFVVESAGGRPSGLGSFRGRKARDALAQNIVDILHLERGDLSDTDAILQALSGLDTLESSRGPEAFRQAVARVPGQPYDLDDEAPIPQTVDTFDKDGALPSRERQRSSDDPLASWGAEDREEEREAEDLQQAAEWRPSPRRQIPSHAPVDSDEEKPYLADFPHEA